MPENLELYVPNELGRGPQRFELRFDGDQFAGPDFRVRYGRDSQDAPVAQKIAHGGPRAQELLQREVKIGRVLAQRIGKNEYPICLSRLIGYNPGAAENQGRFPPYAVFTYHRQTLADLADELPLQPELFKPIADGLIIALCYLQAAQVVHRHIRMETVRWDGTTVQLADFSYAAAEWDHHPGAVGTAPWDSPEQRGGAAAADCRDDVYAAALLLAKLATGQDFTDDDEAREAIARMDLTQQDLLRDADAAYRRDRPTAHELRKRRKLPNPLNVVMVAGRGRESEARARFAALRQRQRSALRARRQARPPGASPVPDTGRGSSPDEAWPAWPARAARPAGPAGSAGTAGTGYGTGTGTTFGARTDRGTAVPPRPSPARRPASSARVRTSAARPAKPSTPATRPGQTSTLVYATVACTALAVVIAIVLLLAG